MLITEAPLSTAFAIASPVSSQLTSLSVPGTVGSGTLSVRAPGQTPRMPIPFCGAEATAAVAVPCGLVTGVPGSAEKLGSPVHSMCLASAATSTSAISGLWGVTGGGCAAETTCARQSFGGPDSGSLGTLEILL